MKDFCSGEWSCSLVFIFILFPHWIAHRESLPHSSMVHCLKSFSENQDLYGEFFGCSNYLPVAPSTPGCSSLWRILSILAADLLADTVFVHLNLVRVRYRHLADSHNKTCWRLTGPKYAERLDTGLYRVRGMEWRKYRKDFFFKKKKEFFHLHK